MRKKFCSKKEKFRKSKLKTNRKPKIDINTLFKESINDNKEYDWKKVGREIW